MEQAEQNELNLFFDLSGAKLLVSDTNNLAQQENPGVGIFIGPEGGWSDFEIDLAHQRGLKIVSLGKLTLRAETAAIAASYLACWN